MKKTAIAVLLSTFVAAPAIAADEGFYVGADVGRSSTNYSDLSSKTGTAFSVLGGYQFMKYLAAEIQYNDFGSIKDTGGTSYKINGYSGAAVGIFPFNDQWSLLGKLGYASTKLGNPANTTKSGITYGIGGQYNINQAWGVRLNYDMYKVVIPAPTSQTATTSVVSAGVVYKF
jgi:OOP family OmpA-OmpF porin